MASVSSIRFRKRPDPIAAPFGQKRLFLAEDGQLKVIDDAGAVSALGGSVSYVPKSASFAAVAGGAYLVDTSAGGIEVTLPAELTGGPISFLDAQGTFAVLPLTLLRNDNLLDGGTENIVCDIAGISLILLPVGGTKGWMIYGR